ncbi:MAG TPA: DNA polymerase III subunit delta', partial [Nitrosomonas sp.]|nr:DNA polymerase III subunit delta' [Nitrosomonas sp.]
MNAAAANALLKKLEEPPEKTLFILVSHQPRRLPATVRSRCQQINMP